MVRIIYLSPRHYFTLTRIDSLPSVLKLNAFLHYSPLVPLEQQTRQAANGIWYMHRPQIPECQLYKIGTAGLYSAAEVLPSQK